jgi:hypothetical protein
MFADWEIQPDKEINFFYTIKFLHSDVYYLLTGIVQSMQRFAVHRKGRAFHHPHATQNFM